MSDVQLTGWGFAVHDDFLFIRLADSIIQGNWLGEFDKLTLAKGPVYPLWIAFIHIIGMRLTIAQQVLYIFTCLIAVIAVKPIVQSKFWLLITFTILLFNPVTFDSDVMYRLLRSGIHSSLTLGLFSATIGLFVSLHHKYSAKKVLFWGFLSGIFLSLFWLNREEGIWVFPSMFILIVGYFFECWKQKSWSPKNWLFLFIPFLVLSISVFAMKMINNSYYGAFITSEFHHPAFKNAYGALTRVKHDNWQPHVPVPPDAWEKLNTVSPKFAEIYPYLNGYVGLGWAETSRQEKGLSSEGLNIGGGWFMWALRDAVKEAGYYDALPETLSYYSLLSSEINAVCDQKIIDCLPNKRNSFTPPWNQGYTEDLIKNSFETWTTILLFKNLALAGVPSQGEDENLEKIEKMTGENIFPTDETVMSNRISTEQSWQSFFRSKILTVYQVLIPILTVMSLLSFLFRVLSLKWKVFFDRAFVISLALFVGCLSLSSVIILLKTMSYDFAIDIGYLSPIFPIMYLFIVWNLFVLQNFPTIKKSPLHSKKIKKNDK